MFRYLDWQSIRILGYEGGGILRVFFFWKLGYSKDTLRLRFSLPKKKSLTGDFAEYFINRLLKNRATSFVCVRTLSIQYIFAISFNSKVEIWARQGTHTKESSLAISIFHTQAIQFLLSETSSTTFSVSPSSWTFLDYTWHVCSILPNFCCSSLSGMPMHWTKTCESFKIHQIYLRLVCVTVTCQTDKLVLQSIFFSSDFSICLIQLWLRYDTSGWGVVSSV